MGAKVYSEKVANGYILIISFVLQFTQSTVFYMYALEIGSMLGRPPKRRSLMETNQI